MPKRVFPHGINYPDNSGITLTDIANTLLAHEEFAKLLPNLIENLLPGASVNNLTITLEEAQEGSLMENFLVAFFLSFQKDITKEVPDMIEYLTGLTVPDSVDNLITLLIFLLIFAGAQKIISRGGDTKGAPSIRGDYNTYVAIAADKLNLTPEAVEAAIQEATKTRDAKRSLIKGTLGVFRPAKRGRNGRIQPRNTPEIPKETVAEFPSDATLKEIEDEPNREFYENVTLEIRATDRDKSYQGWAGKLFLRGFETPRLAMTISPDVDLSALAAAETVKADVELELKDEPTGEPKPVRIHVLRMNS